jgi:uncharacterized protein YuzB (UPF0349 family)
MYSKMEFAEVSHILLHCRFSLYIRGVGDGVFQEQKADEVKKVIGHGCLSKCKLSSVSRFLLPADS